MAGVADLDEIEEVNANCILMANLQQALTSGAQTDSAPVYDSDGSAEVHNYTNCNDNEIFNMFTQEEQYTELLEPIPESHQVPQNDNDVISEDTSVKQGGETVEQHIANSEEIRALYDSLYHNLAIEVEKVNSEAAKFVGDFKSVANEADASLAKHKALELEIERLLIAVVSDQKDITHDTSENTKFAKQPIVKIFPNVGETHALSKPVTLNSVSSPQEPKIMNNDKVIAPGMFRINPDKTSREEKNVPNIVRASNRWSPTGRLFNQEGKIVYSSKSKSKYDCSNGDNACTSKILEPKIKRFPNYTSLLDRVYFVEGLGHNLFSVGQFCDSNLEVAFRRNACFVRNLKGADLLKRDRSTNLYTINLHEM
nr:copia protein [Tanacetum cinerariifolium]